MYTFSGKIKTVSLVLMIIGALSIGYGFFSAPKTTQDIEQAMAHDDNGHGESTAHAEEGHGEEHSADEAQSHLEHLLHQGQNRPWAAFFIAAFFFLMVSVCVLVFYAIQWAAQAGWSIVLFRVMEGITAYILPGSILLFAFLLFSGLHMNHIYVWMAEGTFDPTSENYDVIIDGKSCGFNT